MIIYWNIKTNSKNRIGQRVAEHILQKNGIDLKHLNSNKLHEQIANLISRVIIHKFILSLLPIKVYRIFQHTLITIHCIFLNLHP